MSLSKYRYIVVEGPLAGGHLGFSIDDWSKHDLRTITTEILRYLQAEQLDIPIVPAGGIFTGSDAVTTTTSACVAITVTGVRSRCMSKARR